MRSIRLAVAACLAATGYLHADLYIHGYRAIPFLGTAFLVQASASFAVAVLLVVGALITDEPLAVRLAGAAVAAGALVGFVASRTIGVFGFVEHGRQPWPYALLSLLAETGVLLLLVVAAVARRRRLGRQRRSTVAARPRKRR